LKHDIYNNILTLSSHFLIRDVEVFGFVGVGSLAKAGEKTGEKNAGGKAFPLAPLASARGAYRYQEGALQASKKEEENNAGGQAF
jgi:hypothetical protein